MSPEDGNDVEILPTAQIGEVTPAEPVTRDVIGKVELSRERIRAALVAAGTRTVAGQVPILREILGAVDNINSEVREEKLKILLEQFASKFDSLEQALAQLHRIFRERAGLIVFQKIVQILDNGETDEEWIGMLATTLERMTGDDIQTSFEEKTYLLSQIARLSPQALIVLGKYDLWGVVRITGTTTTSGRTVAGDWDQQAARHFARVVAVTNANTTVRMAHAFQELESTGMIRLEGERIDRTAIGNDLYGHIRSTD